MSATLPVYAVDDLDAADLGDCLVRADNDHRLAQVAWLLVRNEGRQPRSIQAVLPGGKEASVTVPPATLLPSLRNPFGQAPIDTVIGPLGPGPVTYLPAPRGLRVLAFTREEPEEDPEPDATNEQAEIDREEAGELCTG